MLCNIEINKQIKGAIHNSITRGKRYWRSAL